MIVPGWIGLSPFSWFFMKVMSLPSSFKTRSHKFNFWILYFWFNKRTRFKFWPRGNYIEVPKSGDDTNFYWENDSILTQYRSSPWFRIMKRTISDPKKKVFYKVVEVELEDVQPTSLGSLWWRSLLRNRFFYAVMGPIIALWSFVFRDHYS